MFAIKRVSDGRYVARPGSIHSYTRSAAQARFYSTREAAEADRCPEADRVVPVSAPAAPAT